MDFVTVEGMRLAYARQGRGPTLVCLHAIGHSGDDFAGFADAVSGRFEVIRLDWPGQGRSDPDSAHPASARRYADLLDTALLALGVDRPILLGNSIGGAAAILYAARRPTRALVLCDPGGLLPVDRQVRAFCAAFSRVFAAGAAGAWWFPAVFAAYYRLVLPARAAADRRRAIVAEGRRIAPVLAQAWESFSRSDADLRALAADLTLPIWFAWARQDRIVALDRCRPAIESIRTARLTVFEGGHAPFLEQPDAFVAAFRDFADSLEPLGPVFAPKSATGQSATGRGVRLVPPSSASMKPISLGAK